MVRLIAMLALGAGMSVYANAQARSAVPITKVMVVATPKPGAPAEEVRKLVPDEARGVVQLYLEGKIELMYMRGDRGAVILFLNAKTVDEAKAILGDLPLVKDGYVNMEYLPVGPLMSPGTLTATPAAAH